VGGGTVTADEADDEQTPADTKPTRYPECRCPSLAHGGCRCEDDGGAMMSVRERDEHENGPAHRVRHEPRRTR
jgi:hypothetical protein